MWEGGIRYSCSWFDDNSFSQKGEEARWGAVSLDLILTNMGEMIDAIVTIPMERSSGLHDKLVCQKT